MRYAGLIGDDFVNGYGVCVSLWMQGCPNRCKGCHNPQTWDFNGGKEIEIDQMKYLIENKIDKNGVKRNLSILGGEPMCDENVDYVNDICGWFKSKYPDRKIFIWTGFTIEELIEKGDKFKKFMDYADIVVDGKFDLSKRDLTIPFRGSSNQRVVSVSDSEFSIATHRLDRRKMVCSPMP